MQEHALHYGAVQYTAVIAACGKAGQWQSAIALHNRMMLEEGIYPTLQSYTAVLEVRMLHYSFTTLTVLLCALLQVNSVLLAIVER
jgi:pentatricopeptide repeat protein